MATLINFGLIQLTRNEASQLSQSLWQQRMVKNNFQEKELSHKCSTLEFVVAAAATVYQEPHF